MESYGASRSIVNLEGKKPSDMLSSTFNNTQDLLTFHTSPDHHPNIFFLDEVRFNNTPNMVKIRLYVSKPVEKTHHLSDAIQIEPK